jgi:hypothetical protein
MTRDLLAERRAEDEEFERTRRRKLEFIALDMVAEHYGQSDWQRFRRENPLAFLRAKVEIIDGPPAFRLGVYQDAPRGLYDLVFRFDWFTGEWRCYQLTVSAGELQRQEAVNTRSADDFLGHVMCQAAREIERDSGAAVTMRIRGNRSAHEEALKDAEVRR